MALLQLLSDEDFRGPIIEGLRRRFPELDVLRAHEAGLVHTPDDEILDWCSRHGRVVISHDVNTMIAAAKRRTSAGLVMAGLIVVPQRLSIATAIEHLHFVAEVCTPAEMKNTIVHLPI